MFVNNCWRTSRIRIRFRIRYDGYGTEDPGPYKNLTDPEHWPLEKGKCENGRHPDTPKDTPTTNWAGESRTHWNYFNKIRQIQRLMPWTRPLFNYITSREISSVETVPLNPKILPSRQCLKLISKSADDRPISVCPSNGHSVGYPWWRILGWAWYRNWKLSAD